MKPLVFLLLILPSRLFCQTPDSSQNGKLSLGLTFSPDYCYRILKPDAASKWMADSRDSLETPKLGYAVGAGLTFRFHKRLSLGVGLLFSDKGYKREQTFNWVAPNGSNGTGDPAIPMKLNTNYHYYYIDVPFKLNCHILPTEAGGLCISAAVSPNIFLAQKTISHTEYGDGHVERTVSTASGYNKVNLSFTAGMGYQAGLSKAFSLKIEPTFRRSITSIINAPIEGYLYSFGLDMGLYYIL